MTSLRNLTVADLRRELERRESGGQKLLARRAKITRQLELLDAELAGLGAVGAPRLGRKPGRKLGRKPGRPARTGDGRSQRVKNTLTLLQAILAGVPAGRTVTPAQAAAAARGAGYRTAGKRFGAQVAACMTKAREFRRNGRAAYQRVWGSKDPRPAVSAKAGGRRRAAGMRRSARRVVRVMKASPPAKPVTRTAVRPAPPVKLQAAASS